MYHDVAGPDGSHRSDPEGFVDGLQYIARRLRFAVHDLGDDERQFLGDIARGERRYAMRALQRMIAISARAITPDEREALPEFIRRHVLIHVPAVRDLTLAFDIETSATCAADPLQRRFEQAVARGDLTRATHAQVIEALTRQLYATRVALDAVHATRVAA